MPQYYPRRRIIFFFLLLLLSLKVGAQYHAQRPVALKANSRWFFGEYGINFNQQPAQAIATPGFYSAYTGFYGSEDTFVNNIIGLKRPNIIPVSDPVSGNLRFVATIFGLLDRNFAVIPNGDFSNQVSSQDNYEKVMLVAPVIRDPVRYFLFSLVVTGDSIDLLQSTVNMDLNNGLGDIEPGSKNTVIKKIFNENVIVELVDIVPGNNCDLWLVVAVNTVNTDTRLDFLTYHITEAGLDPVPVVSTFEKANPRTILWDYQISPDRRQLSMVTYNSVNSVDFLSFNPENGSMSGSSLPPITFPGSVPGYDVHATFTPDSRYIIAYSNIIRDKKAVFYKYDCSATQAGYRLDSFSYPVPYKEKGKWDMKYIQPTIYFKSYDNKLYINIPESKQSLIPSLGPPGYLTDEYGNPYYAVTGYSAIKLLPFGRSGNTESWRQFSFDPEINLSRKCRLFTNSTVNYPYLEGDTVPTVHDSVLCLAPDERFPSITLAAPQGFTGYTWNDGTSGPIRTISEPGKYWVFYKGPCNNRVDTFDYRLWVPTKILPPDTLVCEQRLPINIKPLADGNYLWEDINSTVPERSIEQAGTYIVQFEDFGCRQLDSIIIRTKYCPCEIGLPNAFSPNNDGLNDYFKPVIALGCVPSGYSLRIFNRWGQLVYSSFNEFDQGWNGTYNGGTADPGTYFYEVRFKSRFLDEPYHKRGELILVR